MVNRKISNLRVTIIGGGGFIGHNLALYLNGLGAKLISLTAFRSIIYMRSVVAIKLHQIKTFI